MIVQRKRKYLPILVNSTATASVGLSTAKRTNRSIPQLSPTITTREVGFYASSQRLLRLMLVSRRTSLVEIIAGKVIWKSPTR
jgi:hypothetical protein